MIMCLWGRDVGGPRQAPGGSVCIDKALAYPTHPNTLQHLSYVHRADSISILPNEGELLVVSLGITKHPREPTFRREKWAVVDMLITGKRSEMLKLWTCLAEFS